MSGGQTRFHQMLLESITPVVMVLTTTLVEEACLKNGISFVGLLRPFCSFDDIDVPVRTSNDQPYRIQKLKLRLFYQSDIQLPDLEAAKKQLKNIVIRAGETENSDFSPFQSDSVNTFSNNGPEAFPSWFELFNQQLIHHASFSDIEAFDHPVSCLLAVSSKDELPINKFIDLFNTDELSALLKDGMMDPKILKIYLLVHDHQDGNSEKAKQILSEMRNTFGRNDCHLLCINSHDGHPEHQSIPSTDCKLANPFGQQHDRFMGMPDVTETRDLMKALSSKHIIPYMEQKVRVLNLQVSATRKGFKNQIKNLLRKNREDTSDSIEGPKYTFSSPESQIRVLGDYAFMLQDYELALSSYRLISTDYRLDNAWRRYAAVQEMIGLTLFMLGESRKEAESCMENAFSTYVKLRSAPLNVTRCGIWWIEMLKTNLQYKEAAAIYFRICNEDLLHSAVMLEQASYCYLFLRPPMMRKYGFHLVLSGDRYNKCEQIRHAIRAYKNAVCVYKGTSWKYIRDYIHFHIGQWYAFLGMYGVAVSHMIEVVSCGHQSKATQELFMRDFVQIVQHIEKPFVASELQLPVIKSLSFSVIGGENRAHSNLTEGNAAECMGRLSVEDMSVSRSTAWEIQSEAVPNEYEHNICVIGDTILIHIEFHNPLQVALSISSVSLVCEHSPSPAPEQLDTGGSGGRSSDYDTESLKNPSDRSQLTLSEDSFSLANGEKRQVRLSVRPNVEGVLRICGVRWTLAEKIIVFHKFETYSSKQSTRRRGEMKMRQDLKFMVMGTKPHESAP